MAEPKNAEEMLRRWHTDDPRRLIGPGHPVGDFLGAPEWEVLARGERSLRLLVDLPAQVMNPRGELFGGFTATYVDFVSLHLFHMGRPAGEPRHWLSTASLHVEYFAPIRGPEIEIAGELLQRLGRRGCTQTRFLSASGDLCAVGQATLIQHRAE
jgi:acyl-coenzyme A thioesterase PaaI-like protein